MREAMILLVEGKNTGPTSLAAALRKNGYGVQIAHTATAALDLSLPQKPDLIVLDGSSMRSSGVRTCRRLRRHLGRHIPIILTRSATNPEDRSAEADVYLAHPFTPRKLLNRVKTLLPANDREDQIVRAGDVTLYLGKRSVEVAGLGERRLTPKLAQLLEAFMRHPNETLSRGQLMETVWKTDYLGDTRTLDVHIRWLRERIEENPARPQILRTVRGGGYHFRIVPRQE